jgi:hypothetical protein
VTLVESGEIFKQTPKKGSLRCRARPRDARFRRSMLFFQAILEFQPTVIGISRCDLARSRQDSEQISSARRYV